MLSLATQHNFVDRTLEALRQISSAAVLPFVQVTIENPAAPLEQGSVLAPRSRIATGKGRDRANQSFSLGNSSCCHSEGAPATEESVFPYSIEARSFI
jgi:hypothetical protein